MLLMCQGQVFQRPDNYGANTSPEPQVKQKEALKGLSTTTKGQTTSGLVCASRYRARKGPPLPRQPWRGRAFSTFSNMSRI